MGLLYGLLIGLLIGVVIDQVGAGLAFGFFLGCVWSPESEDTESPRREDEDGSARDRSE